MDRGVARIVRFWRAAEVFTPQTLQEPDDRVVDVDPGDPMPWEPEYRQRTSQTEPGKVRRYVVFGGVYELKCLSDALVDAFRASKGEDDGRSRGRSALFACRVDEHGRLIEGSVVLSACAYAAGQLRHARNRHDAWLAGLDADVKEHTKGQ